MRISLLLLFITSSFSLLAQVNNTTFKGSIVELTEVSVPGTTILSELPVPGATIMILNAADSTLVQFGSSDDHGSFTIKNVPAGDYLLHIAYLGMQALYMPITSGKVNEKDLGNIKLEPEITQLSGVEVKADYVPIEMTKDTISYNADAFQTQPNAVVEDLLKKLPGIEVAPDGTIKAQGEEVRNILVDGKEFFGSDPQMATKNLPAKALKRVKVYDKQSDMAEFTGVEDGEHEKTIDLQLREEFKKGLFGSGQLGYGTDEKYNAKASINRFTKTSQLSFLGQYNNINDQGFTYSDRMNFSGGMRGISSGGGGGNRSEFRGNSSGVPINNGSNNGLINTGAGGLNFNWQKSKNFNIRSSYFYNSVDKDLEQYSYRQNLSDDPFDTEEISDNDTDNRSHNFALNSDIQLDSFQQIRLNARIGFGNAAALKESFVQNFEVPDTNLENQSLTQTDDTNDNFSLNAGATYMKKLGRRGRNFSLGGTINQSNINEESLLDYYTEYFASGESDLVNQFQYAVTDNLRWEGQFSYTEPLKKRRFLDLTYNYNTTEADYDKVVSDIVDTNYIHNELLSNDYTSVFQYHRPGMVFRYSGEINIVTAGIQYQISELTGHINLNEEDIQKSYKNFLPRFIWRSDLGNGKNIRFSYTTRINQPSITQLSPVVDNSDPLRLYVGNPNLDAEYVHNLNFNFHSFSQFSSTSFFGSLGSSITHNKIINTRFINEEFQEVSSPDNIENEMGMYAYLSFGRPFKPIHSRFTINGNLNYTNTQNLIGTDLLDVNQWTRSAGITISNLNSQVLEYNVGAELSFTDNFYLSDGSLNQNTVLHTYYADATLTLWKKWKLQGSYNYKLYHSNEFNEDQSLPLMGLSLSRMILPGDKGQIKFSIFDVLDENRGLSRTANVNYLEELRSNSIGRYAMLSFIYSIRGHGKDSQGGGQFRVMERRF